uniref:Uncharacterized protein n=1 Tax=Ciona savignyi TaxID=51511 RepID=H2YUQ4_CIOSA
MKSPKKSIFVLMFLLQMAVGCHYFHCVGKRGAMRKGSSCKPGRPTRPKVWTSDSLSTELDAYGVSGALKTCVLRSMLRNPTSGGRRTLIQRLPQDLAMEQRINARIARVKCKGYESVCNQVRACSRRLYGLRIIRVTPTLGLTPTLGFDTNSACHR